MIEGDIRNYNDCLQATKDIDFIFHQAALGSVPRLIDDPVSTTDDNIGGFIGKPLSPYAITKYVDELYAENFAEIYDLEIIGLRYFNVFERKQDHHGAYTAVIPLFVKSLINYKSPVINGDGEHSRDFTYIDNVIQANILAAKVTDENALNQVYNVAFWESNTLNQLFDYLREYLTGYDQKIKNVKPIHGPERAGDIRHSLASVEKAKRLLGYKPKFSLKAGLEKAIMWYWENL